MKLQRQCELALPGWMEGFLDCWLRDHPAGLADAEQRMQLAIALSAENVRNGSGGPFGAIVVAQDGAALVGVGVNLVTGLGVSLAHAEMVALNSQRAVSSWDLHSRCMQLSLPANPCHVLQGRPGRHKQHRAVHARKMRKPRVSTRATNPIWVTSCNNGASGQAGCIAR
jgi:pyrimidine deaminase RibD-like protein